MGYNYLVEGTSPHLFHISYPLERRGALTETYLHLCKYVQGVPQKTYQLFEAILGANPTTAPKSG